MIRSILLAMSLLWLASTGAFCQQTISQDIEHLSDSIFHESDGVVGAAVSVYGRDDLKFIKAYGLADLDQNIAVDGAETQFQVGSVGKIFTVLAVMQLVEEGRLNLDADVQEILGDRVTIDPSFAQPITLRHLLTHSAGFDDRFIGYGARSRDDIDPLGQHLMDRLPQRYAEPGLEISYSNYGYALAGYVVELASGLPFTEYVQAHILKPLGMNHSHYNLTGENNRDIATGYASGSMEALDPFYRNPIPAGGLYTTAGDMAIFMNMFLSHDSIKTSIVSSESIREMYSQQISNHSSLDGYGLGFEIQNFGGTAAVSKGGSVPGFRSILILYPELQFGLFACVNIDDDSTLEAFVEAFNKQVLHATAESALLPNHPVDLDRFAGSYRENRYNRHTMENVLALQYMNLWEGEDGTLRSYQDGKLQGYRPVGDALFQNVDDPSRMMAFEIDEHGKVVAMSRSNKMAGTMIPAKYERLKWHATHVFVNEIIGYPILLIVSYVFLPLFWGFVWLKRRSNKDYFRGKMLPMLSHVSALGFWMTSVTWIMMFMLPYLRNRSELLFGIPSEMLQFHFLVFLLLPFLVLLLVSTVLTWRRRGTLLITRIYYSLYTLSAFALVLFLYRWNFISYNF